MGESESDNGSKFTCTPANLRGPIKEKWFNRVIGDEPLDSSLPSNTLETYAEEFRRLATMNRKPRHSSATLFQPGGVPPQPPQPYLINDELPNQSSESSPLTPGILGEGVFIRLKEDEVSKWESKMEVIDRSSKMLRVTRRMARFILVHTFAHVIMQQFAKDSGLHVSHLRERLYAGEGMAAVLIYAPDKYGRIASPKLSARPFPETLETSVSKALAYAIWCSNDPDCIETPAPWHGAVNLGACRACAILPEASCECMNAQLDRGLLVQTGYAAGAGFFPSSASRNAERTVPR
jgi:hypothetical protein